VFSPHSCTLLLTRPRSYGSGEYLTGTVGFDNVSIGALTVSQQEFGLVNKAAWSSGDGIVNGLLGLSYPAITNSYLGTDPNNDTRATREPYPPFFYSAVAQKKVAQPSTCPCVCGPAGSDISH
jgi:hypothetical protein